MASPAAHDFEDRRQANGAPAKRRLAVVRGQGCVRNGLRLEERLLLTTLLARNRQDFRIELPKATIGAATGVNGGGTAGLLRHLELRMISLRRCSEAILGVLWPGREP